MTPERQNEIWAMLTQSEKEDIKEIYNTQSEEDWDRGCDDALTFIFGSHNLTAQAGGKPKEPKFKIGDKVVVVNKHYGSSSNTYLGMTGEVVEILSNHLIIDNGIKKVNLPNYTVEPYTETNGESDHIPDSAKKVDYFQYRLDLAKEIAVAMIPNYSDWDIPIASVNLANKIIKNLKKTENDVSKL